MIPSLIESGLLTRRLLLSTSSSELGFQTPFLSSQNFMFTILGVTE
jgi:hypothetical protein